MLSSWTHFSETIMKELSADRFLIWSFKKKSSMDGKMIRRMGFESECEEEGEGEGE